jgi:multidrug resistance efflux pump
MKFFRILIISLVFVSCKDSAVNYDASGYFEAEEWTIAASSAGKLVAFDVEEGSSVAKGERLGIIDTVQLQIQKDLLLLQPKSKARDLQEKQINHQLAQSYITALADGIVVEKYAKEGEMVYIGCPLGKIADMENMYLRIYVTSAQMPQIKVGQEVKVVLQEKEYKGKIEWISSNAEFTPKTIQTDDERQNMVYAVKVLVKNGGLSAGSGSESGSAGGAIKIGSFAEVIF